MLLRDARQEVVRRYRLQFRSSRVRSIYLGEFDLDISDRNADGSWNLPVPGTFVIDREGIVRRRHVTADYAPDGAGGRDRSALAEIRSRG
ncbi:MAG: hypothetical protein R2748_21895 [Bryobacterales bacterium]